METPIPSIAIPKQAVQPTSVRQRSYNGWRSYQGTWVEGRIYGDDGHLASHYRLPLHLEIANHSPTVHEWGYSGSGPAQLALALLVDFTGNDGYAQALHQQFKLDVIAQLPIEEAWVITGEYLETWVADHPYEEGEAETGEDIDRDIAVAVPTPCCGADGTYRAIRTATSYRAFQDCTICGRSLEF